MADKDEISVCLTTEEYDKLIKIQVLYNKQKQDHTAEIASVHKIRQKEIAELAEALEKSYADVTRLTLEVNSLRVQLAQQKRIAQVQHEKYQDLAAKLSGLEADHQSKSRLCQEKDHSIAAYKYQIEELRLQIDNINKQALKKSQDCIRFQEEIERLHKQRESIKNQNLPSKQLKQFEAKYEAAIKEKDDLQTKLKVADLRMQSKEEFVCNYYQLMKERLSDFDASEIRELVNNDIDDFIRYLTTKKSLATIKK